MATSSPAAPFTLEPSPILVEEIDADLADAEAIAEDVFEAGLEDEGREDEEAIEYSEADFNFEDKGLEDDEQNDEPDLDPNENAAAGLEEDKIDAAQEETGQDNPPGIRSQAETGKPPTVPGRHHNRLD